MTEYEKEKYAILERLELIKEEICVGCYSHAKLRMDELSRTIGLLLEARRKREDEA